MPKRSKSNVHADITQTILEQLERATGLWECPWYRSAAHTRPTNAVTGRVYNGLNIVALWAVSENKRYTSGLWATYRQWRSIQAAVQRGEKGARSVFYKTLLKEDEDSEEILSIPFAGSSTVFSAEQVKGFVIPSPPVINTVEAHSNAERLIQAAGADISEDGGERAFYSRQHDSIHLPHQAWFHSTEAYYSTVLHELIHWTGAKHRLNRDTSCYAFEELVAELGAAFLCCDLGITATPRPCHAEYLSHWIQQLREDNNAIARAAAQASQAVHYLTSARVKSNCTSPESNVG